MCATDPQKPTGQQTSQRAQRKQRCCMQFSSSEKERKRKKRRGKGCSHIFLHLLLVMLLPQSDYLLICCTDLPKLKFYEVPKKSEYGHNNQTHGSLLLLFYRVPKKKSCLYRHAQGRAKRGVTATPCSEPELRNLFLFLHSGPKRNHIKHVS